MFFFRYLFFKSYEKVEWITYQDNKWKKKMKEKSERNVNIFSIKIYHRRCDYKWQNVYYREIMVFPEQLLTIFSTWISFPLKIKKMHENRWEFLTRKTFLFNKSLYCCGQRHLMSLATRWNRIGGSQESLVRHESARAWSRSYEIMRGCIKIASNNHLYRNFWINSFVYLNVESFGLIRSLISFE